MEDQKVSSEIARLLVERKLGFDMEMAGTYMVFPTQTELAKWLREKGWHYIVEWDNGNLGAMGMWFFKYRNTLKYPGVRTIKFWDTFEEATDDALLHILKLL